MEREGEWVEGRIRISGWKSFPPSAPVTLPTKEIARGDDEGASGTTARGYDDWGGGVTRGGE